MADILTKDQVTARASSLSEADVDVLHAALNSAAGRVAPCLEAEGVSAGLLAEARLILFGAIDRREDVQAWVKDITTGPYRVGFRDTAATVGVLSVDDQAALRALCGGTSSVGGLPEGSFPSAGSYDRLFGRPRY